MRLFGGGTGSRELLVGAKAMCTLSQSPREVSWGALWPFRTVLSTIQRELSLVDTLAHRVPEVSCILEGTRSCVPLSTAVCANLDPQCRGPLLFLLMWGEGLLCTSFLLYPACASEQGFHSPRGGPRLSLGSFHQGSLEERENDLGEFSWSSVNSHGVVQGVRWRGYTSPLPSSEGPAHSKAAPLGFQLLLRSLLCGGSWVGAGREAGRSYLVWGGGRGF